MAIFVREKPARESIPWRWAAAVAGAILGVLLWSVAGTVQGDGLFHLARARKLLELDELSLRAVGEFADASLHPGLRVSPLARLPRPDLPDLRNRSGAGGAPPSVDPRGDRRGRRIRGGLGVVPGGMGCGSGCGRSGSDDLLAPGSGGAYVFLALPATSSRQLLVPAALALALTALHAPTRGLFASTAAAGFVLAVVHPTYAIFLWIPFVGFLLVRALWTRQELRPGGVVLAALAVPAAFFMIWLLPTVADPSRSPPTAEEVQRAFDQYPGQLDIRSETSYSLAPEVFTRSGPVAIAALLLIPFAAFAARRRWAAFVAGGSLAVLAFMLVPPLFANLSDLVSISQARRAAGFLPFAFAFAGGLAVLARVVWPWLPPIALVAGAALQYLYPGDFDYAFDDPGPAWVVWFAVVGCVAALVVGFVRRARPPVEDAAGLAAAFFLIPVVAVGLAKWSPVATPPLALLSPGIVEAVREKVPERAVVYSDQETSYRIAAYAPVYVAVAPPGHVADTMDNRPYERARDARRFLRTGDLAIPRRYGAEYLVVDRARGRRVFDLQELYRDPRYVLYRLPSAP